jgi:hypothetical protein
VLKDWEPSDPAESRWMKVEALVISLLLLLGIGSFLAGAFGS